MKNYFYLTFVFCLLTLNTVSGQQKITPEQIDWPQFLSRHDMYWDRITTDYYSGAIMGNGLLGNNIYKEGNAYKFHIGRVDVTEGRTDYTITTNRGAISFKSYVHASQDVIVLETNAEGDEVNFVWEWVPLEALSPRAIFYPNLQPAHYIINKKINE